MDHADLLAVGQRSVVQRLVDARQRFVDAKPDQGARGADGLAEPVGQIPRGRVPDRGPRLLAVVSEGRQDARLDGPLDDHHLGARAQPADEVEGQPLGTDEARRRDIRRLHRGGGVEDDDDALGAVAHHGHRGTSKCQGQGEQRQQLQDQQRVSLQPLEEGRSLAVAQRRVPEEEARHHRLPAPHLEEVEKQERDCQEPGEQRERREEAHASRSPLSWRSTISSTGVSVVTRW